MVILLNLNKLNIKFILNKSRQRFLESALIANSSTIMQRNDSYNLSRLISELILKERKLNLDTGELT